MTSERYQFQISYYADYFGVDLDNNKVRKYSSLCALGANKNLKEKKG
ncbi:MAG: hypothetical protein GTO45_33530 [Candidatus Aminicenantes bacterium]|nr:hypothetical protein [Candidatus Aminicenantes bacterium]NIM79308.1 hypothetical protein [Candidatus Aminicenantes bacterium]NIN23055.1 hypothetical protein [Candidatus Aminicenantes bacterium]NIN46782.1 hypothetical protein [Candidatus Aminicenantes bacterium]NIN89704.1 hypothetical protein [Candidatus Aminicenantes bacterium]